MLSLMFFSLAIFASNVETPLLAEALTCTRAATGDNNFDRFTLLMNARVPTTPNRANFDLLLARKHAVTQLALARAFESELSGDRKLTRWEFQSESGDRVIFSRVEKMSLFGGLESQTATVQLQYTPAIEYTLVIDEINCANLMGFSHLLGRAKSALKN